MAKACGVGGGKHPVLATMMPDIGWHPHSAHQSIRRVFIGAQQQVADFVCDGTAEEHRRALAGEGGEPGNAIAEDGTKDASAAVGRGRRRGNQGVPKLWLRPGVIRISNSPGPGDAPQTGAAGMPALEQSTQRGVIRLLEDGISGVQGGLSVLQGVAATVEDADHQQQCHDGRHGAAFCGPGQGPTNGYVTGRHPALTSAAAPGTIEAKVLNLQGFPRHN